MVFFPLKIPAVFTSIFTSLPKYQTFHFSLISRICITTYSSLFYQSTFSRKYFLVSNLFLVRFNGYFWEISILILFSSMFMWLFTISFQWQQIFLVYSYFVQNMLPLFSLFNCLSRYLFLVQSWKAAVCAKEEIFFEKEGACLSFSSWGVRINKSKEKYLAITWNITKIFIFI